MQSWVLLSLYTLSPDNSIIHINEHKPIAPKIRLLSSDLSTPQGPDSESVAYWFYNETQKALIEILKKLVYQILYHIMMMVSTNLKYDVKLMDLTLSLFIYSFFIY